MSALDELDFTERVPAAKRRNGGAERIRVRGDASGPGSKVGSLLLSIPMMGMTLATVTGLGVAQLSVTGSTRPDAMQIIVLAFAMLAMVVAAVLWGALARMSSLGPTLWGLVTMTFGIVLAYYPSTRTTLIRQAELLPESWRPGFQLATLGLGPLIVGALLLGLAFAASLTRRAPRQYVPDALGL